MGGDKLVDILWIISLITNIVPTTQEQYRGLVTAESPETVYANEGDIFDFKCSDQTLTEEHYIVWIRKDYYTEDDAEIYRNGMLLTSDLGQEALAYSLNNSTKAEFTITIEKGLRHILRFKNYRCVAIATSTGNELLTGYVVFYVYFPPPAPYPLCTSTGFQRDLVGQTATLTCKTQQANPLLWIQWWRNEVMVLSRNVAFLSGERFTEYPLDYNFILQQEDLDATYQCRVTWWGPGDITTCTAEETSQTTILPTTEPITDPETLTTKASKTTWYQTNIASTSIVSTISRNTLTPPTIHQTTSKVEVATTSDKSIISRNTLATPTFYQTTSTTTLTSQFLIIGLSLGAVIVLLLIFLIILLLYKRNPRNQMLNNGVSEVTDIYNKSIEKNTEHVYNDVADEKEHIYNDVAEEKEHVYDVAEEKEHVYNDVAEEKEHVYNAVAEEKEYVYNDVAEGKELVYNAVAEEKEHVYNAVAEEKEHVYNDVAEEKECVYNDVKEENNKEHVYYNDAGDKVYINTTTSGHKANKKQVEDIKYEITLPS